MYLKALRFKAFWGKCAKSLSLEIVAAQRLSNVRSEIAGNLPARAGDSPNHSAGDFCTRISRWLGGKIVGMVMDDDRPTDHFVDGKTVGQKHREGKPVVPEQRRQISGVIWMPAAIGVVVGHGICKRIIHIAAAVGALMDMKPKNSLPAGNIRLRQAADLGEDDHSRIGLIQPHSARYAGIIFTARDAGRRLGPAAQNR